MSEKNILEFVPKDKCRACGHSWPIQVGVLQMLCPLCKSSDIIRADRKKFGLTVQPKNLH